MTAFPGAFLSIQPREGSAIFWYNMKSSGEPDLDVTKGECPLIHGVKWGELLLQGLHVRTYKNVLTKFGFPQSLQSS